jgi:hypothetical protein
MEEAQIAIERACDQFRVRTLLPVAEFLRTLVMLSYRRHLCSQTCRPESPY